MTTLPPNAIPPSETRTLLALVEVWTEDRRATMRSVSRRSGFVASTTGVHIRTLRDLGLVSFEDDRVGTLRPAVRIVAVFP